MLSDKVKNISEIKGLEELEDYAIEEDDNAKR